MLKILRTLFNRKIRDPKVAKRRRESDHFSKLPGDLPDAGEVAEAAEPLVNRAISESFSRPARIVKSDPHRDDGLSGNLNSHSEPSGHSRCGSDSGSHSPSCGDSGGDSGSSGGSGSGD